MGMLRKVEEKQSSYYELKCEWDMQAIYLCVWVTLMDTMVGILVDLMGFIQGMA